MVSDSKVEHANDFIISTNLYYRSAHAAEFCGFLDVLQSIDYFLSEVSYFLNIDMYMATYYLDVTRKSEKQATVVII